MSETSSAGRGIFQIQLFLGKGLSLLAFKMVITQNSVGQQGIKGDHGNRLSIPKIRGLLYSARLGLYWGLSPVVGTSQISTTHDSPSSWAHLDGTSQPSSSQVWPGIEFWRWNMGEGIKPFPNLAQQNLPQDPRLASGDLESVFRKFYGLHQSGLF